MLCCFSASVATAVVVPVFFAIALDKFHQTSAFSVQQFVSGPAIALPQELRLLAMDGQASDQLLGDVEPASSCPVAGITDLSQEVAGAKETPVVLKHGDAPALVLTAMELEEIGALRAAAKRRLLCSMLARSLKSPRTSASYAQCPPVFYGHRTPRIYASG